MTCISAETFGTINITLTLLDLGGGGGVSSITFDRDKILKQNFG